MKNACEFLDTGVTGYFIYSNYKSFRRSTMQLGRPDPGSEERYRERVLRQLNQRAIKMGMRLVAVEPTA